MRDNVKVAYLSALCNGRDNSTVDGRSKRKCYWTGASYDCGRLHIGDV